MHYFFFFFRFLIRDHVPMGALLLVIPGNQQQHSWLLYDPSGCSCLFFWVYGEHCLQRSLHGSQLSFILHVTKPV